MLSGLAEAWNEIWSESHAGDDCQHAPGSHHEHQRGKCPSCESTTEFVKIGGPQIAKAKAGWHFAMPLATHGGAAYFPPESRPFSAGNRLCPGLRAHLILGVMLI